MVSAASVPRATPGSSDASASPTPDKVDLNAASEKELETLPGVGPSTAKKIIAGRPYAGMDDLKKAGFSDKQVSKIADLVTFSTDAVPSTPSASDAASASASATADQPLIDLNAASDQDLETLPGVGPATAKKIIAGRPFTAVSDLKKAGLTDKQIAKIQSLVTVSGSTAADSDDNSSDISDKAAATPPQPGMVWVNLSSGVYNKQGDRYYGKTKSGKFMAEADAIKAGYRLSGSHPAEGSN
jgi:DNA uptake protein ComE-like DNA-binding protein